MHETIIAGLYPRAHRLLGLAVLFVAVLAIVSNAAYPRMTDFLAYWAASVLTLRDQAALAYDPIALAAVERIGTPLTEGLPFGYPPAFLLLALPFGLVSYPIAAGLWIGVTATAYVNAARRLLPGSAWLAAAFPPVVVNAVIGQTGLLTAALVIGASIALPRRPLLAGLLVGCLVIKPQLAILFPLALVAGGQWRAIAGAALSSLGLSAVAFGCFGQGAYIAFLHGIPLFASVVAGGLSGWHKMASVYSALRLAGLGSQAAWTIHLLVALAAAAMVVIVWRGRHALPAKIAVLVAASMLISPYLYVYDTVALVVPFFWLAAQRADRRILALLWLLPIVSILQNWDITRRVDVMPLVPIALLALLGRRLLGRAPVGGVGPTTSPTGLIQAVDPHPHA